MTHERPAPALPPAAHPGVLALVGSGEYLPAMQPVDRYLLGLLDGPAQVVCLPTAAGTEGSARIAYWSRLGEQHFRGLGAAVQAVPVIDRASANDEALAGVIRQANFVYLSGGKPDYLYRTLQDTPVWEAIQAVLGRGGVLAGCSAGAMILGERLPGFPAPGLGQRVFGLLPGTVIMPHFDEIPAAFTRALRGLVGRLALVGIDGNTALVSTGGRFSVVGTGRVVV
ncbi:MAG: Type 1 glutamine amidotransferase-like domain-containing protein [Chloroflexota bacterium]